MAALPQFLSPFRWLGLSDHGNALHYAFFDIGPFAWSRHTGLPRLRSRSELLWDRIAREKIVDDAVRWLRDNQDQLLNVFDPSG